MKDQIIFYKKELVKHQKDLKEKNSKLIKISIYRFLAFSSTIIGVYWFFQQSTIAVIIGLSGVISFLFLVKLYAKVETEKKLLEKLIFINEEEIKISNGEFYHRNEGLKFQDPKHFFSLDIDLFGRGSFFQYMNRTDIDEGTQKLVNNLTSNIIVDIKNRQEAIKELSTITEWRQRFSGIASLIKVETSAVIIIDWLKKYKPFLPQIMKWLPLVFSIISLALLTLSFTSIIAPFYSIIWLMIGLITTGKYLKKVSKLSIKTSKAKETFRQYSKLLNEIEDKSFLSEELREEQQKIFSYKKIKASEIFNDFSRLIDALDNRNNLLFVIFGNGFLLWDIMQSFKIEQWIKNYHSKVSDWFEVVSYFDAYNSLGNFAFNHPNYSFPEIVESKTVIQAKNLGHPLLNIEKRIDNDLTINHQQFFIITGANMAGKSTFLRTVSLHIVMANVGLPVCAIQSKYSPVKLITSMRTTDSLTDDSSYFFSELTRLKFIVDEIKSEPYFIVLDEILKGTNSTDKAIGSRKFVERLVKSSTTGIIATHDLSLCEIEKELKEVQNYYFDAEIVNDELYFDYLFKDGICKNMNASFLLKKMKII